MELRLIVFEHSGNEVITVVSSNSDEFQDKASDFVFPGSKIIQDLKIDNIVDFINFVGDSFIVKRD